MMRKKVLTVLTMVTLAVAGLFCGAPAWADDCVETAILGDGGCYSGGVEGILNDAVDIFTAVIGILGVIGIVVVGIQYLTARDNSGQVAKAKNRLLQIVIGLAIYVSLYAILRFLIPSFTR